MKHTRNATVALTIFPLPVILETCPQAAFLHSKEKIRVNVLLTGAAGYIGSICAEVLLSRVMNVVTLDDLREGHRAANSPGSLGSRKNGLSP